MQFSLSLIRMLPLLAFDGSTATGDLASDCVSRSFLAGDGSARGSDCTHSEIHTKSGVIMKHQCPHIGQGHRVNTLVWLKTS